MRTTQSEKVQAFFENATVYLANRPSIRMRCEIIHDLLGDPSNASMLDIGCGDGSLSMPYVRNNRICFLDFSTAMLEHVKERIPESYRSNATLLQANVEEYAFVEKYDIILCVGVLAHVQDVDRTIQKIISLLKPQARLILQVSDTEHFYYKVRSWFQSKKNEQYGYRLNIINPEDLVGKVNALGLSCQKRTRYPVVFPLVGWFGSAVTFAFLRVIHKTYFLRFLASEHIMLFQKK